MRQLATSGAQYGLDYTSELPRSYLKKDGPTNYPGDAKSSEIVSGNLSYTLYTDSEEARLMDLRFGNAGSDKVLLYTKL